MKGIYLASYKAYHSKYDIDYNDIKKTSIHTNIIGDMLDIDLSHYDYIIATPPCNYWSRANYRRETSEYSQQTKHLLPSILLKLQNQEKPYIVENVRNKRLFQQYGLYNGKSYVYEHGRHTYWTNIPFNPTNIEQEYDFSYGGKRLTKNSQGGDNVYKVIEYWLQTLEVLKK